MSEDEQYDDEYYEQIEAQEWSEYVEDCVADGCTFCGHEVEWDDMLSYHICIYCE